VVTAIRLAVLGLLIKAARVVPERQTALHTGTAVVVVALAP
jgi:hypothetical protein